MSGRETLRYVINSDSTETPSHQLGEQLGTPLSLPSVAFIASIFPIGE